MKVISVAFSLLLAQSVVAQNSTDDYADDLYNATTYAPTSASAGVTVTVDTPSPTPSGGDDDWSTYAPTSVDGDDYASVQPTVGSDDASVGTPAPSAGTDDSTDDYEEPAVNTTAPSATGTNYVSPLVSTPAPSSTGSVDYEVGTPVPSATSIDYVGTPAPSATGNDDYAAPTAETSAPGTYAPTPASDDESDVTVEEVDDAYSMDYSSTVAAVNTMESSAAVRGAATVVLGLGCMAYYLL
jgi:hypothetical protein